MNYKSVKYYFITIFFSFALYNFFSDLFFDLAKIKSEVHLILDISLFLCGLLTLQQKKDKIYFSLFIVITLFTQLYNAYYEPIQYFNGLREFVPLFCAPLIIKYLITEGGYKFIVLLNTILKIFLFIQIPISILQYLKYGPGDQVGGTLGNGFSGQISIIIYLSTFYIFKFENINFIRKDFLKIIFIFSCWIPTFINETKISFILIPIFFLLQAKFKESQIIRTSILSMAICILLLLSLKTLYNKNETYSTEIFNNEYISEYLFGEESTKSYMDVPRFLKLKIGIKLLSENINTLLIGKGLGHFKGGTILNKTEFASQNEDLMQGSIIYLFFVVMQLGVLGLILILIQIFRHFFFHKKMRYYNYNENIFYIIVALISIIYGTSFRWPLFCIIFFFIINSTNYTYKLIRVANRIYHKSVIAKDKVDFFKR